MMLLLMDIGNTTTQICTDAATMTPVTTFLSDASLEDHLKKHLQTLKHLLIDTCVVTSVVPTLTNQAVPIIHEILGLNAIVTKAHVNPHLKINLDNFETLGADRFVNAVAISHHYKNQEVLLIDFGTATTYDYISKDGALDFGLITLGVGSTQNCLSEKTSKLPKIELSHQDSVTKGTNTYKSIETGLYFSLMGSVKYIIQEIEEALAVENLLVIATGGYGTFMTEGIDEIHRVHPHLIFDGMKVLYDKKEV